MDFYVIPPLKHLNLMHSGDRYFCLAQLYVESKEYRDFFKRLPTNAWVTLDNGAGDHSLVTEDVLFKVMSELMPNEVIPPDVLFDAGTTMENAEKFYKRMQKSGLDDKIEILFCPQGKSADDWFDSYLWGLEQSWIKTIGMSKIAIPKALLDKENDTFIKEARHIAFNMLKASDKLQKPLHLLGMGDPREYAYYQHDEYSKYIRSSDSANSVWSAINGIDWTKGKFKRIPTPKAYFQREISADKLQTTITIFENNVDFLRQSVV